MSETTGPKQHLWKPGQSDNPAGRPKGSRNKLGEEFIAALQADFQRHGSDVIAKVREERPDVYLKVVASILPKELHVTENDFDGMTLEELQAWILQQAQELGLLPAPKDVVN